MRKYDAVYKGIDLIAKYLRDLYMDDTSNSFHESDVAQEFYKTTKEYMKKGGFDICKWESNCAELRTLWNKPELNHSDDCEEKYRKVLGVLWDISCDQFVYNFDAIVSAAKKLKETKRNWLKVGAMFYDPPGLICPLTLQPKLYFKKLCIDKLDWDAVPTAEISKKWNKFIEDVSVIEFRVHRHLLIENRCEESIEIHGFADASIQAYAAAVYIRVVTSSAVTIKLLAAKSKVAPMKELKIPNLELLSCLLLAILIKSVLAAIEDELNVKKIVCWTDSEIAYYWITQVQKEWKTWVENLVNRIRNIIPPNAWRHVPGTHNPADLATREMSPTALVDNSLWWEGPEFLHLPENQWPEVPPISAISTNLELKMPKPGKGKMTRTVLATNTEQAPNINNLIDIDRYSCVDKLLRVTAYVLRFVHKTKVRLQNKNDDKDDNEELTTVEINTAEQLWLLSEQSVLKSDEKFDKRIQSLRLYPDEQGIIRSRTRISESYDVRYNKKHPILLRDKSRFTKLLVLKAHERVKHQKVDGTLNEIRNRYWIVRGRQVVHRF